MNSLTAENETIKKFLAIYDHAVPEPQKIDNKMKRYHELFVDFDELTEDLRELDTEDEQYERHMMKRHQIENDYYDNTAKYEKIKASTRIIDGVSRSPSDVTQLNTTISTSRRRLKLPQSTLPTFDGSYDKWLNFKGEFGSMIHDQDDISDVDKLAYLRRALTGPAFDKIKMLPMTAENYARAWKLLNAAYSDKRLIISSHLNLLMKLPKQEQETAQGLSQLVDDTRQHYETLKMMGIELTPEIIVIILENKLHRSTADDWDETIKKGTFPPLDDLLDFLSHRAGRLAIRNINKTSSENHPRRESNKFSSNNNHYHIKKNEKRTYTQAFVTSTHPTCSYCKKEAHPLFLCTEFKNLPPIQRLKVVREQSYCINCLRNNHQLDDCYSQRNCRLCEERHNTSLHSAIHAERATKEKKGTSSQSPLTQNHYQQEAPPLTTQSTLITHPPSDQIILSAMVNILDQNKQPIRCRVLLDTASTANFITESLAKRLGLPKIKYSVPVGALNQLSTCTKYLITATIQSTNKKYETNVQCLTIPVICGLIPTQTIPRDTLGLPRNTQLADPDFHIPRPVDMLLGSAPSLTLFTSGQYHVPGKEGSNVILQKTRLGWVVGGSLSPEVSHKKHEVFNTQITVDLTRFFEIEEGPARKLWSPEEKAAEDHFLQHHSRMDNGRYMVALPFKSNPPTLGESRDMAIKRFNSLERRLNKDVNLKSQYHAVIEEYLSLQHMSKIVDTYSPGYYLPHHAVIKESSMTTKVRVVFDGSAKTSNGISLNETLMIGPTIQDDLFSLILRFRTHQYVLTGDIEKMYRQFLIHPSDRKYQRILWRDEDSQIVTYELNTVTFGLSAAPFLAIRCLKQLALDESEKYPTASRILQEDMYVDDLLTGFNSIEDAQHAQKEITRLLEKGSLNIRQWASNENKILQDLPPECINQHLQLDNDKTIKTLGISWNSEKDAINYKTKPIKLNKTITKRTILSTVASIFDPLGLLGPVILKAKNIIQQLWSAKVDWDESIPLNIQTLWIDMCMELPLLNDIQFNRKVIIKNAKEIQIHGFCDASNTGYGACIYIKSINHQGLSQISLLCSKSRVAPIQFPVRIPRLELCGAHTLVMLHESIIKAINLPISKTILWTDSTITLHWIHTPPHTLKTFVQNRVTDIQQKTMSSNGGCEWKYVPSGDNPADSLSRGQLPSEFIKDKLWQHGPHWLKLTPDHWPQQPLIQNPTDDSEKKRITCLHTKFDTSLFQNFNSFNKLIRTFAYCFRLTDIIKRNRHWQGRLSVAELQETRDRILLLIQSSAFSEELQCIRQTRDKGTPHHHKLSQLNPIIDDKGLLRVGGRLNKAELPDPQKHPIILPKNHIITDLIIQEEHLNNLHSGVQGTLYSIRQTYWIINGRNQIRRNIRKCITCVRANPPPTNYIMGHLPAARVSRTIRPFVNVGVDYCGPFYIKEKKFRNKIRIKVYVAVFICLAVKAVHLEVVSDLTSSGFLAALDRFIARRGKPTLIQSDNGTNFTGANNELKKIIQTLQQPHEDEKITRILSNQGIQWKFTPPLSPHFGGIWEAAVKSFKHHVIRVMGLVLFTFEEFNTLVIQIEAILNSRPITPMSADPNDLQPLTPAHFLLGDTLTSRPELNLIDEKTNSLTRWELIQKLKQEFWTRWHKEYLNELNIRKKWTTGSHDIKKNSIVLLKDDNLPPMQWKLGRVVETHPGTDGIIRVVTVRTATGELKRNSKRISPLPVSHPDDNAT